MQKKRHTKRHKRHSIPGIPTPNDAGASPAAQSGGVGKVVHVERIEGFNGLQWLINDQLKCVFASIDVHMCHINADFLHIFVVILSVSLCQSDDNLQVSVTLTWFSEGDMLSVKLYRLTCEERM